MNEYIRPKVEELPQLIFDKEKAITNTRKLISADERSLKFIEISIKKEISSEKALDTGKAVFSNEKSREEELYVRKCSDDRHLQLEVNLEDKKDDLDLKLRELTLLFNELKVFKIVALMKSGGEI